MEEPIMKSPPPVTSPLPKPIQTEAEYVEPKGNGEHVIEGETFMKFPEAMEAVTKGKKVTRLEWKDRDIYFVLHGGHLRIHKADKSISDLIVSEGDMLGEDYIII